MKKNLTSRQVEELIRKKILKFLNSKEKAIDILQLEKELSEITGLNSKY